MTLTPQTWQVYDCHDLSKHRDYCSKLYRRVAVEFFGFREDEV